MGRGQLWNPSFLPEQWPGRPAPQGPGPAPPPGGQPLRSPRSPSRERPAVLTPPHEPCSGGTRGCHDLLLGRLRPARGLLADGASAPLLSLRPPPRPRLCGSPEPSPARAQGKPEGPGGCCRQRARRTRGRTGGEAPGAREERSLCAARPGAGAARTTAGGPRQEALVASGPRVGTAPGGGGRRWLSLPGRSVPAAPARERQQKLGCFLFSTDEGL